MMLLNTADELLDALAQYGGVIVGTNKLTEQGVAIARACGRMYVNADGLGFVVLPNCVAHPNLPQKAAMTGEVQ
jgi:hypothetical protein